MAVLASKGLTAIRPKKGGYSHILAQFRVAEKGQSPNSNLLLCKL